MLLAANIRMTIDDSGHQHFPLVQSPSLFMSLATTSECLDHHGHSVQHPQYPQPSSSSPSKPNSSIILPAEIVARIFLIVVETDPNPRANLYLSHICSRWRSFAIETQLLWQHITVRPNDTECGWTQICVDRCSSCPIDITIPPSMRFTATQISKFLDTITSCLDRLRRVTIHIDHMAAHRFVEWFAQCDRASSLELLSISIPHYTETEEEGNVELPVMTDLSVQTPVNVALRFPSLASSLVSTRSNDLSFAGLKYLQIGNQTYEKQPNLQRIISIISRSLDLQTLILQGPGGSINDDNMDAYCDPITFPSLTHLEISHQTCPAQAIFLGNIIRAPSLQSLVLAEWIVAAYDEAIQHFGVRELYRTITSLRISGINVSTVDFGVEAFMALFEGMPNIEHLTIELHGMNPIAFSCLSHLDVPVVLPAMRSLKVSGSHRICVMNMVTKRKERGLPIHDLYLQRKCDMELPHLIETIRNCVTNLTFVDGWDSESNCSDSDYGYDSEEGDSGRTESDSLQDTDEFDSE